MVQRFSLLRNIGKFDDVNAGGQLPFARLTVIYAENGRGKTTLSAVLRSLASGTARHIEERRRLGSQNAPHVVIDIDGGAPAVFQNGAWSRTNPNIAIFDDAFVSDNVCSGIEVSARHRQNLHELIIGAPGVALNQAVQARVADVEAHIRTVRERSEAIPLQARQGLEVDEFCALAAVADLDVAIEDAEKRLAAGRSAGQIAEAATFSDIPLPKIELGPIEAVLDRTIVDLEAQALERVQVHLRRLGGGGEAWASAGMAFAGRVQATGSADCPFCAQDLAGSEVIAHYRTYFSEEYEALKAALAEVETTFDVEHSSDVQAAFERGVRVVAEGHGFWKDYADVPATELDTAEIGLTWKRAREAVRDLIAAKRGALLDRMSISDEVRRAVGAHNARCDQIGLANDELEIANDRLRLVKEQAGEANLAALESDLNRLKAVQAHFDPQIAPLCDAYLIEKAAKAATEQLRDTARADLENYRQNVFPAYGTAINAFLQRFNAGFRIGPVQGVNNRGGSSVTYTLMIDGQPVPLSSEMDEPTFKNSLSSGDRSTLALAFFFAALEADPQRAQKVVVIDDPMTSLDEHRSLHTLQEIEQLSRAVSAVIVLSHSKPFLSGVWDKCRQVPKAALEVRRIGGGSTLAAWDVTDAMLSEHDRRYSRAFLYMVNADPAVERQVAESLRPMLETYVRVAFANEFEPGRLLGDFVARCLNVVGTPQEIMSPGRIQELRALMDFANRYHHAINAGYATEHINDAELLNFTARTLAFMGREITP